MIIEKPLFIFQLDKTFFEVLLLNCFILQQSDFSCTCIKKSTTDFKITRYDSELHKPVDIDIIIFWVDQCFIFVDILVF